MTDRGKTVEEGGCVANLTIDGGPPPIDRFTLVVLQKSGSSASNKTLSSHSVTMCRGTATLVATAADTLSYDFMAIAGRQQAG